MEKIIYIHVPFNLPDKFDPAYKDSIKEFITCQGEICDRFGVRAIPKFRRRKDSPEPLMGIIDIQIPIDVDNDTDIRLMKSVYDSICKYCKDRDRVYVVIAEDVVMNILRQV